MKLNFAVDYMKILEADDDTALVELDLLHTGKNRNGYFIGKEAVERAIPTIYNKPIIYRLNNEFIPEMATDVVEHGTIEDRTMRIAGTIPESATMEFVERNGKEYLRTKGIIHKIYQPSLMNILRERDGNLKVSIEILVSNYDEDEDGSWIVNDFKFEGVALLGEGILEGIEGSQLNVIKFSAKDYDEHYKKFSTYKIPERVKECVNDALEYRNKNGRGGSSSAISMAKYLASNDYIDYTRFNYLSEYFNKNVNNNSLSFSLYGGEASKEWIVSIKEERDGKQIMNGILSSDLIRGKIFEELREMESEDEKYTHWVAALYDKNNQVVIDNDRNNEIYLVEYKITEDNEIVLLWDTKKELNRCYLPVEKVTEDALLFNFKEIMSIDEDGQLITNTHRLSAVDSAEARKAEELLNSLEKEGSCMEEEKEVKNASEEEKIDNACNKAEVDNACEEVEVDNVAKAEEVEKEEEKEDKEEDKKEEKEEDFAARCKELLAENEELKASLETYKKKEEIEKMNSLIDEFSYCFKADEKEELKKDLSVKTFAEVEDIVNEKVKAFAKENKPKEEDKDAKFSIGLMANNFSYKKEEENEKKSLKDIINKYKKN